MWRIQGLVCRVLSRCHANAPLRITPGHHHVEDDVRSTSTVLSTGLLPLDSSSRTGGNGERGRRERTSQFCYSGLPRYTALDAVGWGVAAMLLMQICRRIHSHVSSVSESNLSPGLYREAGLLRRCGYRVLLEILCQRDVLPRGLPLNVLGSVQAIQGSSSSHAHSSESPPLSTDSAQSGEPLSSSDCDPEDSAPSHAPTDTTKNPLCPENEELTGAANNLKQIADSSVPVILNIIGLENAKRGEYRAAFSCFLASAQHGYSKAQFNAGVCYETGRGVRRDRDKAARLYSQAAAGGHSQAMYRYAKHLLRARGQQSAEDTHAAVGLLEAAAESGVTEAQTYLGVLFTQDSLRDERKAVRFLKMAADNGDPLSQLYLGQCYESGFGVRQCFRTAVQWYRQAAKAGNQQAQSILSALYSTGPESVTSLRPIRSSPCLSVGDSLLLRPSLSSLAPGSSPIQPLPHSWSTGSFQAHSLPSAALLSGGDTPLLPSPHPSRWTIGLG